MAKDLNRATLLGRLGQDPDLRYTQGGTAVCTISLATNSSIKLNGEWEDITEWHKVVFWGKMAEVVEEYLSKGSRIYVEGRLQTRSWEDNDGVKRYVTEIVARDMIMLDSRQDNSGGSHDGPPPSDDDVPF